MEVTETACEVETAQVEDEILDQVYGGTARSACECTAGREASAACPAVVCC